MEFAARYYLAKISQNWPASDGTKLLGAMAYAPKCETVLPKTLLAASPQVLDPARVQSTLFYCPESDVFEQERLPNCIGKSRVRLTPMIYGGRLTADQSFPFSSNLQGRVTTVRSGQYRKRPWSRASSHASDPGIVRLHGTNPANFLEPFVASVRLRGLPGVFIGSSLQE